MVRIGETTLKESERPCTFKEKENWIDGMFHSWGIGSNAANNNSISVAIVEGVRDGKFRLVRVENLSFASIPGTSRFKD